MAEKWKFKDTAEMSKFIKGELVKLIDACFMDPLGMWHHCTFAPSQCEEQDLKKGFAFDGSSIRLFCTIDSSDIIMLPDPSTCWIDPFQAPKVLHVTCTVYDTQGNPFPRCPRVIANKAVQYLISTGIADTAYVGPEAEFFLFDEVRFTCSGNRVTAEVDGESASWNTDIKSLVKNNLGHRVPSQRWYFPVSPIDSEQNLRNEMLLNMKEIGIPIEKHHHEVASCQHELGYCCRPLVESADLLIAYKYVVKNTAKKNSKTATFMPKPMYGDNGSGMHCHQSLWKHNVNLFFNTDKNYAAHSYMNLSKMAMHYIGGLLKHAKAVLAFSNPTVNSYKRLTPGYEAPTYLFYSKGNRSASIRIPLADSNNSKSKRIEFRCPDASSCPYLAFAAMLLAGIDGIINEMNPGDPIDLDISELSTEEKKKNSFYPYIVGRSTRRP